MTTEHPFISIITVVYNNKCGLEKTILSIKNQLFTDIEYIVIDGNSSDGTVDIIKKYADCIDCWVSEPDNGIYDAMNKGIGLAHGKYISLLNAGDYYEENTCSLIYENAKNHQSDVYYGLIRGFHEKKGIMYVQGATMNSFPAAMINHPTCFIKKEIYDNELYDTTYVSSADFDFIYRLYIKHYSFCFIEKILCNFEVGGMSSNILGGIETLKIQKKYTYISGGYYYCKYFYYSLLKLIRSMKKIVK